VLSGDISSPNSNHDELVHVSIIPFLKPFLFVGLNGLDIGQSKTFHFLENSTKTISRGLGFFPISLCSFIPFSPRREKLFYTQGGIYIFPLQKLGK